MVSSDNVSTPVAVGAVPIAGIGASAGGLAAFTRLLRRLPLDTGYAFVLIQHLDASHPSSLSEILGRATAMPVDEASDGQRVAPNHVYVIPPNAELTIANQLLKVVPRLSQSPHMPVDVFMESAALDCGASTIGVVLSGNGSDGTAGLMAIREAGGITFAQEPTSAGFRSMPSQAAAAGADWVLPPEGIASELARIAYRSHAQGASLSEAQPATPADEAQFAAICNIVREAAGIDFSLYRTTTVQRRILRRLAIRNLESLAEYTQLLTSEPTERIALQRDLLIGVTSFFRDPDTFHALKRLVFPSIVRGRAASSTIRIWVPGCATGEEAYSILMALHEYQSEARTDFPVQVFGSDVSDTFIERARSARYPESIASHVGPERLSQHFRKVDRSYQIAKSLREQCIFTRHDLLEDPPFSGLDLVSCRNVLVYLDSVRERIVPLFHYALVDHGFLMLGRAETVHHVELFATVEPGQKIYSKRQTVRRSYGSFLHRVLPLRENDATGEPGLARPLSRSHQLADMSREADRLLLSRYGPPGMLVDESLEVLEIRGHTAPFLALTEGKASLHLLKVIPDTGLFLEIEKLIRQAARTGECARHLGIRYEAEGYVSRLNVDVFPLRSGDRRGSLILFEAPDALVPGQRDAHRREVLGSSEGEAERDLRIATLSNTLADARARLISLLDEHELSYEVNQRVAEEALSANEELQSLTEELETAKEELQSANEELLTINRELASRNLALASAQDVAKVTLENVAIPLLIVDSELVVRQINPAFADAFRVSLTGVEGLSIYDICDGAWDVPALRSRFDALAGTRSFEPFALEQEFPSIGRRVLMLSGCRLESLGLILLTVEDVTQRRQAEDALKESGEQLRQSEKMEIVGRLAGGIAHDFNNLLTVIIGCSGLIAETLGEDHEIIEEVEEICGSAKRAAALTEQLLAFSRRKVLQPKVFDLHPLLIDFERMLRRLLSEQIKIAVRSTPAALVRADAAEIGRVVMNLCLNARDAMPAGGTLSLETAPLTVDRSTSTKYGVAMGAYIRLVIRDTGLGMDSDTQRHAFEPYFTTKDRSTGAGLGLATVFGIMKQSGGAVLCESSLGEGTRFTVLLPAGVELEEPLHASDLRLANAPRGASEVVFLVEDETGVRRLTRRVLQKLGYVVLEAKDGREGLSEIQSYQGKIDILISDVVMPEMSGRSLVENAVLVRPGLKVLFVSGHPEDVIQRENLGQGARFLQKPYTPIELARKVREILDDEPEAPTTRPS